MFLDDLWIDPIIDLSIKSESHQPDSAASIETSVIYNVIWRISTWTDLHKNPCFWIIPNDLTRLVYSRLMNQSVLVVFNMRPTILRLQMSSRWSELPKNTVELVTTRREIYWTVLSKSDSMSVPPKFRRSLGTFSTRFTNNFQSARESLSSLRSQHAHVGTTGSRTQFGYNPSQTVALLSTPCSVTSRCRCTSQITSASTRVYVPALPGTCYHPNRVQYDGKLLLLSTLCFTRGSWRDSSRRRARAIAGSRVMKWWCTTRPLSNAPSAITWMSEWRLLEQQWKR